MYLARRVEGARIWVYQVHAPVAPRTAWRFEPGPSCCLCRTGLSGNGMCAFGETPQEAREFLRKMEEMYG
jgi:hypothetical protein